MINMGHTCRILHKRLEAEKKAIRRLLKISSEIYSTGEIYLGVLKEFEFTDYAPLKPTVLMVKLPSDSSIQQLKEYPGFIPKATRPRDIIMS